MAPQFTKQVDFIFLDGDHSLDAVIRDWQDWLPKVKLGGIIAAHDCRVAPNSAIRLGSMDFYEKNLRELQNIREITAVDSLVVFEKIA